MQRELSERIRALQNMTTGQLREEWRRVMGGPPRSGNVAWMRKRLIHAAQVAVLGDLSPEAKARLEYLMQFAPAWVPMGKRSLAKTLTQATPPAPEPGRQRPGSILTRPYKGRTVQVLVRENGFEFDGRIYPSLTAVTKAVTGSHWNGNLFFGLTKREKTA